jgi:long-chain acyl-CoA synthetase/crotonobetaine/carnitine-CoA ligase
MAADLSVQEAAPAGDDPGLAEIGRLRPEVEALDLPESLGAFAAERARVMGEAIVATWFEDDVSLSYRELDRQARALAAGLVRLGVRKGTHVGVMLSNCAEFPVTWIALGAIGAVMVPVNTAYTGEEVSFVLNDSDAQFLVVDEALIPVVHEMKNRPGMLGDGQLIVRGRAPAGAQSWADLASGNAKAFEAPSRVARTDLLNLQYTSGTTGFPKGCMLTHDYWMMIAHNAAFFRSRGGSVRNVLIWAPFFYMDPMWQFLMTMRLGGTAYIARRMSLSSFYGWLKDYEIHYCIFPEPALKHRPRGPHDSELSLRYVSIYGWRAEARREIEERFGVTAREGYGMTEIGSGTIMPPNAGEKAYERTCGLPAPWRELRIVDDEGRDVPQGEIGELWVAGRSILWGYHKRPEANADSFRGRWFRTGDLFRQDEQGYFFIVGRIKDMVKRAGENIAAQEVEAALRDHPDIEEAAVVAVPDPDRREEVKAYLKLRAGATATQVTPSVVLEHCANRLARFKIPRYITYVDDFPRTPSRKIAKKVLIADVSDLRVGAFDRDAQLWR